MMDEKGEDQESDGGQRSRVTADVSETGLACLQTVTKNKLKGRRGQQLRDRNASGSQEQMTLQTEGPGKWLRS